MHTFKSWRPLLPLCAPSLPPLYLTQLLQGQWDGDEQEGT